MRARRGYAIAPSDGTPIYFETFPPAAPHAPFGPGGPHGPAGGEAGEASASAARTPVVLCDGIGCDGYVWRYLRRDLSDRLVVHAHYRGHGRSAQPNDPTRVTIPDLADDLAAVLDEVGVPAAVIAGHSMGVQVALETYRRHPARVRGLLLACGAPSHPLRTFRGASVLEEILPRVQRLVMAAPRAINRVTRAVLPTRLAFEIATRLEINRELVEPDDFMPYLEGMARMDTRLFVSMLGAAGQHSADDLLPEVRVPALVIAGARDGFTPPARSRDMAAAMPDVALLEIEEGSHTAPIERPDLVRDAVTPFLGRIDGAAGAGGGASAKVSEIAR